MRAAVRRCRCAPSPANRSCSWGSGRSSRRCSRSIRSAWPRASSGWAMWSRWSRTFSARSTCSRPRSWPAKLPWQELQSARSARRSSSRCASSAGLSAVMDKLPAQLAGRAQMPGDQADRELRRQMAIIDSMTRQERLQLRHHRRLAPTPDCGRRRGPGPGRQPIAQAIHGDAETHEGHERRQAGSAVGRSPGACPGRRGRYGTIAAHAPVSVAEADVSL